MNLGSKHYRRCALTIIALCICLQGFAADNNYLTMDLAQLMQVRVVSSTLTEKICGQCHHLLRFSRINKLNQWVSTHWKSC